MGLGDIFNINNLKAENERLQTEVQQLQQENQKLISAMGASYNGLMSAENVLSQKKQEIQTTLTKLSEYEKELDKTILLVQEKKAEIIELDEVALLQSFGFYTPQYDFATSDKYKEKLESIRNKQKDMIKAGRAITGTANWTVDGNAAKGKKMVQDFQKLILRAFNGECDELVSKVKYNNFDSYLKRLKKSKEAISKLGVIMNISISEKYYDLKVKELTLAFEYALKVQQEKEQQRELREQMREKQKIQKEIEEAKKKLEKEQTHYENALEQVNKQIATATGDKLEALQEKKAKIESQLVDNEKARQDVDYRQANQKAGYVYIISNIGSFGENVYKIGMTRRLDPQDRIDELGGASVPFRFDVHALIFSDDAPALEAALHHAFTDKRINMINNRKEFFKVSIDEIKKVVYANYDKTVAFVEVPLAEQYRLSEKIRFEKTGTSFSRDIPTVNINDIIQNESANTQPTMAQPANTAKTNYRDFANDVYQAFGNDTCIKCSIENGIKHTIVLTDDNVKIFDIKEDIHNNLEITMFYPDGSVFEDYEMGSKRPIDLFNYLI